MMGMRWQGQSVGVHVRGALPGLDANDGFVRTVRTPEFAGITFHEVLAKSALNRIPAAPRPPEASAGRPPPPIPAASRGENGP